MLRPSISTSTAAAAVVPVVQHDDDDGGLIMIHTPTKQQQQYGSTNGTTTSSSLSPITLKISRQGTTPTTTPNHNLPLFHPTTNRRGGGGTPLSSSLSSSTNTTTNVQQQQHRRQQQQRISMRKYNNSSNYFHRCYHWLVLQQQSIRTAICNVHSNYNSKSDNNITTTTTTASKNYHHSYKIIIHWLLGCIVILLLIIIVLVITILRYYYYYSFVPSSMPTTATTTTLQEQQPILTTSGSSSSSNSITKDHLTEFHNVMKNVTSTTSTTNEEKHQHIDQAIYSRNSDVTKQQQQQGNDTTNHQFGNSLLSSSSSSTYNSDALQIVWLMSFPNSGTSYTSRLVRDTTQTFTASNYADETPEGQQGIHIPVYTNQTTGPFWTIPMANINEYHIPTKYVLTKTHCGIRCSLCSPNEYAETTYSFRRRCLVTKFIDYDNKTKKYYNTYSTYPITNVVKAVHMIRNPFDNVVSRFHLEHSIKNNTAANYSPNRHGFLRYCLSIDFAYVQEEMKYMHFMENKVLQDLWLVPCHADFIRYIEWHNLAFITTADLQIPTYILHYDWYSTQYNTVLSELLHFLQLQPIGNPPLFVTGKVYTDYYTIKEQLIVKRAFEFMASSITWKHIQQYLPPD